MILNTLYKKTNTGAIQYWKTFTNGNEVHTEFGQVGTDSPQKTVDIIKEGKNIGKANGTTPITQAELQAKQQWDKKIKSGYSQELSDAQKGETNLPGIKPMLAQVFEDREKEVRFSLESGSLVFTQPKFDGMRLVAVCEDYKVSLYSRTQKLIETLPHTIKNLELLAQKIKKPNFILDGEAYNHKYKEDFNELMSIIKRKDVHPNHTEVQYHVYDIPSLYNSNADKRLESLDKLAIVSKNLLGEDHICFTPSRKASTMQCIENAMNEYLDNGYEGAMIRLNGPYEFKRSKYLLKFKKFVDDEFEIVGFLEGKGKLMGHIGSFECLTKEGKKFTAKMEGNLDNLKTMFENKEQYLGKMLTVEFFNYTPDMLPRFPVGKAIRED